jgi:hypothetical protein
MSEEREYEFDNWEYISYDLWGNDEDGYEVNAAYTTGQIYEIEDWEDDTGVIRFLRNNDFLHVDDEDMSVDVDGDEHVIYINHNGWPACEFRRTDQPATQGGIQ